MKISVFGGTFDPPHNGHINLARSVVTGNHADRVLFIPSPNPPHKKHKRISSFADRSAMLQLAIQSETFFDWSNMEELRLPEPSYTVQTMAELTGQSPNDELFWLIGGDSLIQLHTWYKSSELVSNYNLMTYPRPGEVVTLANLQKNWQPDLAQKLFDSILDLPVFNIASTNIRRDIQSGADTSNLIDPLVAAYINAQKIYE